MDKISKIVILVVLISAGFRAFPSLYNDFFPSTMVDQDGYSIEVVDVSHTSYNDINYSLVELKVTNTKTDTDESFQLPTQEAELNDLPAIVTSDRRIPMELDDWTITFGDMPEYCVGINLAPGASGEFTVPFRYNIEPKKGDKINLVMYFGSQKRGYEATQRTDNFLLTLNV